MDIRRCTPRRLASVVGLAHLTGRAALVFLSVLFLSCTGSAGPSATPGGAPEVLAALARRGITVRNTVGGDPGCSDASLAGNALHVTVTLEGEAAPKEVYLFVFRDRDFAGSSGPVEACAAEIVRRTGQGVGRVEAAPFRALGTGWTTDFQALLAESLREAARGGTAAEHRA